VQRALREIVGTTLVFAGVLGAISGLLAFALPQIQARIMKQQFIPPPLKAFRDAMLGVDSSGAGVSEIAFAIAWSHPIVLTLLSAHAIMVCTRVLAGEVERGTVDVLLALPVSRWRLLCCETLAWVMSGVVVLGGVYAGSYVGAQFIKPEFRPEWSKLLMVWCNLGLVYLVIGCFALLLAHITDRRGRAVLGVIVVTIFSLLINFLHTLDASLEFTKRLAFMSFLEYYKPFGMLISGEWPWKDLSILALAASVLWVSTGIVLARRDVTTT